MKVNFNLNNLQSKDVSVETLTLNVEYSIEEFVALMKTYPEMINLIVQLSKEN